MQTKFDRPHSFLCILINLSSEQITAVLNAIGQNLGKEQYLDFLKKRMNNYDDLYNLLHLLIREQTVSFINTLLENLGKKKFSELLKTKISDIDNFINILIILSEEQRNELIEGLKQNLDIDEFNKLINDINKRKKIFIDISKFSNSNLDTLKNMFSSIGFSLFVILNIIKEGLDEINFPDEQNYDISNIRRNFSR